MTPGRRERHMLDPFVLGERFSGGTGIEGRPKVKKSAKLNYHIIMVYWTTSEPKGGNLMASKSTIKTSYLEAELRLEKLTLLTDLLKIHEWNCGTNMMAEALWAS